MTKVAHTPPADLAERTPSWVTWPRTGALWQIANSAGPHPTSFGRMRRYGPLPSARFDPHPGSAGDTSGELILYAAATLLTALAERFQHNREIRRTDPSRPVAYAWHPTRDLTTIDLRGPGAVALGAAHAISSYRKDVTRRWASALRAAWPDTDGLCYASAMTGEDCLALWAPAADSFPAAPAFARPVDTPAANWQHVLRSVAARLGYTYS
jgi:hypothetical protein